ncbi:XRE family transcriptional regulator [Rheinheimera sediminis]|uniref:helix-turn-helix transcriptional regulator n=1 Tax=Rheinheimera sp. YQF-1 TaxID=2499626 RepID=UPI000FDC2200|nr:helix-turn-helix transcriptional regulator [Rheinheimera sp. YQF-1]RVT47908.1 XRE family transcriptional regulator [Rheinheimera sp. YQF-1]
MKISNSMSDGAIAAEIFSRLESRRKELNLTQEELACRVGITRKSYAGLEKGITKMATFIAIIRHLELLDNLDLLVSKPEISPLLASKNSNKSQVQGRLMPFRVQNKQDSRLGRPMEIGTGAKAETNPLLARRQRLLVKE